MLKKKQKKINDFSFDMNTSMVDLKNLDGFHEDKFETVLERPLSKKRFYGIFVFFIVIIIFYMYKTFVFQIIDGEEYSKKAISNFSRSVVIFSDRGVVFDRKNEELIWNKKNENDTFSKRGYLEKKGFSHLLGFLSYPQKDRHKEFFKKEYKGKAGIEKYFNDELNGKVGTKKIELNSLGKVISDNLINEPKPGKNIILSIDSRVQNKMAISLHNYIKKYNFVGGGASIMNVKNGEIISMVSLPEYSSKILTDGKDKKKIKSFLKNKGSPFLNRVVSGEYAPGSIVKPFVALKALDENIFNPKTKIFTDGKLVIPNKFNPKRPSIFKDWKNHGSINLNEAMANSSNVYFYLLGGGFLEKKGLGIKKLNEVYGDFGFGLKTEIFHIKEKKGLVPDKKWKKKAFKNATSWNIGNTYHVSIGQFGFLTTPLQVLVAISGIANDGFILRPSILKNQGMNIKKKTIYKKKHFKIIRRAMRETVLSGTTQSLNFDFVKIASKSGSAQIKNRTRKNSWVIGFFPYKNPKYAFVFLAEDGPKDVKHSVAIAASEFFNDLNESGLGKEYFK